MATRLPELAIRYKLGHTSAADLRSESSALPALTLILLAMCNLALGGQTNDDAKTGTPTHWSFLPGKTPQPPQFRDTDWVRNPIDAFVLRKLHDIGVEPAPPAAKIALLRRASFDLLGLPPTPEEIDTFRGDDRPDAYERLIERMLSSAHYGERWGRHWLDVVRHADSGGFEADLSYSRAWQYRDYVIRSFNADKPFDRFIHEQVAGDEIWPNDADAALGSAMYCIGPVLSESAMVEGQIEYEWLTDAADTTGEVFLGLTIGCARCHDHKYDPIRQRDYYALQAIFAASDRPYPEKVRISRIKALNGLLSDAPVPKDLLGDPRCTIKLDEEASPRLFHRDQPLTVHRLHRGELNKPQEVVEPGFPAFLMPPGKKRELGSCPAERRRTELARWLTSRENPLVARVLVNRIWGWHFGRGIVRTPNNFGSQGEEPTHPELLDFLASDLIDHGWSIKRLHRLIMLSSTYRMSTVSGISGQSKDPENLALWHFPRRRLEGEEIRDALLVCAGLLNRKQFGEPVVPPLGRDELSGLFDAKDKWPITKDQSEHLRRSIYLLERRTFVYPLFASFDPPGVMTSCARRMQTIVPAQALTLLNSPLTQEAAAEFAKRLIRETGRDRKNHLARGWLLAYGRPITREEAERAELFLDGRTQAAKAAAEAIPDGARSKSKRGSPEPVAGSGPPKADPEEAALAELCLALFNSNEFVFLD